MSSGQDEAVAAALALKPRASKSRRSSAESEFLRKETRKLDLEMHHLRLRHFNETLTVGLKLLAILAGAAVVASVAAMAWAAHLDNGLVIQPFSVPPDLAQRGLNGEVVASQVLDGIANMQAQTSSVRPADSYERNWGDDIKVEIPDTGVSIGELNRWLRQSLGHETRISGEVYRTPTGVAVTARVGSETGVTFSGTDAQLPLLIAKSAEAVYAETQPYRHAVFALAHGRPQEAMATFERLAREGSGEDRAWALAASGYGMLEQGRPADARRLALDAIRAGPRLPIAYGVLNDADYTFGREEERIWAIRKDVELVDAAPDPASGGQGARILAHNLLEDAQGDYKDLLAGLTSLVRAGSVTTWQGVLPTEGNASFPLQYEIASAFAEIHQPGVAMRLVSGYPNRELARYPESPSTVAALAGQALDDGRMIADAVGPEIVRAKAAGIGGSSMLNSDLIPRMAWAQALLGRRAAAEALISDTPVDCYLCLRMRGRIAAQFHDWAGAERWFAEAVRQAPSSPFAYVDWARALIAQGRPADAEAKLSEAAKAGPHYADVFETWGEARLAKGDLQTAIAEFKRAHAEAAFWGRNHLLWGEALMLSGRYGEARKQYEAADRLDLSKGDRAALDVLLARSAKGPLHG